MPTKGTQGIILSHESVKKLNAVAFLKNVSRRDLLEQVADQLHKEAIADAKDGKV